MSGRQPVVAELRGQTILVTGAVDGIGRATAGLLASAGANVIAVDINPTVVDLNDDSTLGCIADATDPGELIAAMDLALNRFGPLSGAVLNVALERDEPLELVASQDFAYTIDGTLGVTVTGLEAVIPFLKRSGGGSVVLLSSGSGFFGEPGRGGYATGKAGINGLTLAASREWRAESIRVNAVAPGPILTPRNAPRREADPERVTNFVSGIPLGRWGDPPEVAAVIAFLLSPRAVWINGAVVPVDGGMSSASPLLRPLVEPPHKESA